MEGTTEDPAELTDQEIEECLTIYQNHLFSNIHFGIDSVTNQFNVEWSHMLVV